MASHPNKKFELLRVVLHKIKAGKNPAKIKEDLDIPKTTLQYTVDKLKKLGCIEKVGYGVWSYIKPLKKYEKVPRGSTRGNTKKVRTSSKEIRGHAYIWKVKFEKKLDWNNLVKQYKKKTFTFQYLNSGIPRTIFRGRKIWLTKSGLIIYEPLDFYGRSSFETKGMAVFELDQLVKLFLIEIGDKPRPYKFTTSREHYGMIKNELARQYNDRKEKMVIRTEEGTAWLWIDDSKELGELETNEPVVSRQVQDFWNDHKKTKFEVKPSFILNTMAGIQQNQQLFSENIKTHIQAIQDLGKGVDRLTKLVEKKEKLNEDRDRD